MFTLRTRPRHRAGACGLFRKVESSMKARNMGLAIGFLFQTEHPTVSRLIPIFLLLCSTNTPSSDLKRVIAFRIPTQYTNRRLVVSQLIAIRSKVRVGETPQQERSQQPSC